MEEWSIQFGVGVGPLKFGMSSNDASAAHPDIGNAQNRDPQPDGTTKEFRDMSLPILIFDDGKIVELQIDAYCRRVDIFGRPLFEYKTLDLMRRLEESSAVVVFGFDTVVFPDLGLSFADFVIAGEGDRLEFRDDHRDEELNRVVTVSALGAWNGLFDEYNARVVPILNGWQCYRDHRELSVSDAR